MAYGVKYQFSIEATNGDEVDIFLLQRDYSGQKHIRALGRAPILKRERNGCILGTSLEIFAECRVDGEFAELYTSDAYEYKVEVYKRQMLQWTGFVSPELYAEPDIAPPYDVQIIATDGLGELKNYDFAAYDRPKSYQAYIESMLEHTGHALAVEVVSDLQYYDEGWSDANGLESIVVDLSHKAGENCYDVLQAMLTSVNACITQQDGSWTVIRESDLYSWRDTIGSMEFGSMNSCDWWPVGNLNADVIPAKKYLSLTSENHYKPTVLQNSAMASDEGWAKEYNAAYDETEKAYILPDGGSNIRQTVNFFTEVGYRLFLHISARNVGDAAESQKLGVMIKINGRMYQAGDEFWLKELADYEGRYAWSNTEGYLEFELPEPSDSETRADASDIEVVIPLYKYDSRSYAYATSLEVMIFNISGVHDIYLYECSLQQYEQPLGHKIEAVIANGARESVSDIELALNDGTYAQPAAEIFRNAIPIAYHSEAIIQKWKTPAAGEGSYLLVMAKDYAMQVALPRMRYRGKLNVPSMAEPVVPLLFFRDGTYYFLNTYSYDLLNDELEVELISIPSAVVSIESEKISEIALPGTASGTGTGGSGVAGSGTSITIDTEMSDTSTNPVRNRAIKAYVDSVDNQLEEKIGNLAERIDSLENGTSGGAGAAIFDATCATDPWSLNVLQTQTTYEEIAEAINAGRPIYMRFMSGLVAIVNAELYDSGDISLYAHLVDPESHVLRTIHTYGNSDSWSWEAFDESYASGSSSPSNVAIDFQGLYALISLSPGVADAEMASVGLTTDVISGILEARYNKAIGAGDDREVWNYDGYDGGTAINIFFRQGDGFDVHNSYSLRRDTATGYWTIYYTEI